MSWWWGGSQQQMLWLGPLSTCLMSVSVALRSIYLDPGLSVNKPNCMAVLSLLLLYYHGSFKVHTDTIKLGHVQAHLQE